jgi:hypothetical protein
MAVEEGAVIGNSIAAKGHLEQAMLEVEKILADRTIA